MHFELERYEFENGGKNETSGLEKNFMSFEKESEMMRHRFQVGNSNHMTIRAITIR